MTEKEYLKVNFLKNIEKEVQQKWDVKKKFEANAPSPGEGKQDKYFVTFPFPYMNGKLHLGHAFTLTKCEFSTRYQRLKGKRCLFPFGFHCTGMPIKACADKLKREFNEYGFPPKFPTQEVKIESKTDEGDQLFKDKSKGKKSKAAAKAGVALYQYQIMESLGIPPEDIRRMAEAEYWLDYFPPLTISDLKTLGMHIDWRRSFITTDVNPFFDSFVRWQYIRLHEMGKIKFGKRYTIYSPKDGQPCMDHDRSSGEGVGPQEYTLIKLKALPPYPNELQKWADKKIYLVAATLRPETMYGQTNCWVGPELDYTAFETVDGEVFVCTKRAAVNMSFQGFTKTQGEIGNTVSVKGQDLIGVKIEAPMTSYKIVYALPMLTIKNDKGTGIVTSVPSDSPDDYAVLVDLKKKKPLREKYGVTEEMVLPFSPVEIIDVPELGTLSAVKVYDDLKIQSQNDKEKLAEAKEKVYLKGFYEGKLIVGEHKGKLVKDVKKIIQKEMTDKSEAVIYYEPEKTIISRSGEECVVSLCDQWYLDYGEPEWRKTTEKALESVNTYHDEVRKNFHATLEWLHEHACSRTYGLGTRLPWDEKWLIESLSDSCIYMSYYTIAHFIQGNTLRGSGDNALKIKPEQMTPEVWDYIFLNTKYPKCQIKKDTLDKMKNEFRYWYPLDLRVSGKDLIQNHLTYFLYVHTAIWSKEPDMWPKGVRANGHLLLNSLKMSKSEGNFLTLSESLQKYGADGTRLALADSGDSIEDANFLETSADSGVLRLFTFIDWVKEILSDKTNLRTGEPAVYHDKVFLNEIDLKIKETESHYENMFFKEALRTGFFELQKCRDKYRELTQKEGMNERGIKKFIRVQAILVSPICPHTADHIYSLLGEEKSVVDEKWPSVGEVDHTLIKSSEYLMEAAHSFRLQLRAYRQVKRGKASEMRRQPDVATVWIAKEYPPWQGCVLSTLKKLIVNNLLPDNKLISVELSKKEELKRYMKRVMPFVQMIKDKINQIGTEALSLTTEFDEKTVLSENKDYLTDTLNLEEMRFKYTDEKGAPEKVVEETTPGSPFIEYAELPPGVQMSLVNPQPKTPYFKRQVQIRNNDSVETVCKRITKEKSVELWRWEEPEMGPRRIPNCSSPSQGSVKISKKSKFILDEKTNEIKLIENDKSITIGTSIKYFII